MRRLRPRTRGRSEPAVSVGDAGYVITFSHNEDSEQADRDAVDRSILATWSWG